MHDTDTSNRFVNISVDMTGSGENLGLIIKFLYLDRLSGVKRYYDIEYGPDCINLQRLDENQATYNNSIVTEFESIDLSCLGNSTELCISVVAGTGNKRVRIEGMYDINKQKWIEGSATAHESAFQVRMSLTYVGSIGLLITILMM
jgi:cellobiose-specific phosphotransferase system component IIC